MGNKGIKKEGFSAKNVRDDRMIVCLGYEELAKGTGIKAATLRNHWRNHGDSLVYSSGDWVIMRGEYIGRDLSGYRGNLKNFKK